MSSNEDECNDESISAKKRRVQCACDDCRRKKIVAVDGGKMLERRCSTSSAYTTQCAYLGVAEKCGPSKGYVERLENRLEKLESLLHKICPNEEVLKDLVEASAIDGWSINTTPVQQTPSSHIATTLNPATALTVATLLLLNIRNIVQQLAFAGDLPLLSSPPASKKQRDADCPASQPTSPCGSPPSTYATSPFSASSPEGPVEGHVCVDLLPPTTLGSRGVNRHHRRQQQQPQLPMYSTELGRFPSSPFSFGGSSSIDDWTQTGSKAPSDIGDSTFQREALFVGDLGLGGPSPAASSPSPYSDVAGGMAFHQAAPGMQSYGSSGGGTGASDPRVFPALESHWGFSPMSSFDNPDFGVASGLPASGHHTGNTPGWSTGPWMDMDFQTALSNDVYSMWSNAPSGIELNDSGPYLNNMSNITNLAQPYLPGSCVTGHRL